MHSGLPLRRESMGRTVAVNFARVKNPKTAFPAWGRGSARNLGRRSADVGAGTYLAPCRGAAGARDPASFSRATSMTHMQGREACHQTTVEEAKKSLTSSRIQKQSGNAQDNRRPFLGPAAVVPRCNTGRSRRSQLDPQLEEAAANRETPQSCDALRKPAAGLATPAG